MVTQSDWFWFQGMQAHHGNTFECIRAFSETDFTEAFRDSSQ